MDIDELKSQWKSMELRIDRLEKDNKQLLSRISSDRMKGVRGKLIARYRAIIMVCVLSPSWIVLMDKMWEFDNEILIIYTFFFFVMALANYYMCRLIEKIDSSVMSIKEALVATAKVEDTRQKVKLLGWILAVPLTIIMFDVFQEIGHPEVIYGACAGLVIGGVVGYLVERKTRRLIRELRQTLADALADDEE
ncbi:MAG: hypothetical protein IKV32_03745 [Muribaculaceae bacterium]|nr:hypothetical protein [Muribaculaceae bacterium]